MEDQGKRLLIAVALVALLYVAWSTLFPSKPPAPTRALTEQPTQVVAPEQPASAPAGATSAPAAVAAVKECTPEREGAARWDTPDYEATFSRCGGALASFKLKGSQYRVAGENGKKTPIDLVRTGENPAFYPLQVQVNLPEKGGTDPNEKRVPAIAAKSTWELVSQSEQEIVFRWADRGLEVTKTYRRLPKPSHYGLTLDVEVKNASATERRLAEVEVSTFGYQDPMAKERGTFSYAEPHWTTGEFVDGDVKNDSVASLREGPKTRSGDVRWLGMEHKYFLFAIAPTDREMLSATTSLAPSQTGGVMESRLTYTPPWTLEPNQSLKRQVVVYAGPKLLDQLEAVSTVTGKDLRLGAAVQLGWFSFIARPMLWLLKVFHGWLRNWGLAIILLTITVKLLTLYWTQKSMRSMKEMSKLKPKIDELREKYANDKQRQNVEMMNLYKAHKINPLGGCLPMVLQMPVWFALYATLGAAAELYQAPFVGWIHDLTAPDPYYIIPVALVGLMFLQAKISPAAVDSAQQKMMMYMMPLMFGGFSLFFPAGLTIYILTNTLLSMAHQYYMNRTDKGPTVQPKVIEVKEASAAKGGGKKPGGGGRKRMVKA